MALEKSNIPIAFAQGLDTKTDPKQIPAGKFLNLENAVFLKTGEIRKRNGFKQYLQLTSLPGACSTFKDQLFLLDRNRGYSFSPGQSTTTSLGSYGPFDIGNVTKKVGVAASVYSACAVDSSRNLALFVYQYDSPNFTTGLIDQKIKWSLHDLTTDAKILEYSPPSDIGRRPQVVTNDALDYYIVAFEQVTGIVSAGSFTIGQLWEITELGTTNWNGIGYVGTPVVGGRFVSTGGGAGTGKAGKVGIVSYVISKNPANFISSTSFVSINASVYSGFGFHLAPTQYPKIVWSSGNTGADTQINYFPLSLSAVPGTLPTPVTLAGTSCRVGASVSGSYLGGLTANLIALNDGTNIRTIVYDETLTTVLGALRVAMTVDAGDSFNGVVTSYLDGLAQDRWAIFTTTTRTSLTIQDLPRIQYKEVLTSVDYTLKENWLFGAALAGPAFTINPSYFEPTLNRRSYIPVKMVQQFTQPFLSVYDGQYSSYLINFWETHPNDFVARKKTVCVKYLDLNSRQTLPYAGFPLNQYNHFPEYYSFTSGFYASGDNFYALIPDAVGDSYLYKFSKDQRPIFTEIGNSLYVSGGILRMFDGWSFSEHNFIQQPLQVQFGTTSAGAIPAGTYYYQMTYEWRDAYGQVHRSLASAPSAITLASSLRVPVVCSTLKLTDKNTPVWIGLYRSNDGVLFYKVPNTGVGSTLYTDKSINSLTFTDNTSQTFISSQPLLYTVGGELDNACAPACNFVATYKRRLVLVPSEDTNSFWYSKEIIPTTADAIGEPVNFALEFIQSVNEEDGKVTGLAEMDDKLIIFKTSGISVTVGNGPAPNGANNDFSLPQRLATDTGCLYGRSIVLSPLGLLFQSPKGFYLLDRSLTVSYIGAPVENFNSIECTSANLMYDRNEIWFALQDGKILVYNYYFNQFSNLPSIAGGGTNQHATIYKGVYVSVAQIIKVETPGIYQDVSAGNVASGYAMKVTTGWMSFAQVQGFQRVYKLLLLGDYKSSHRLQVQASVDFDDTVVQTSVITPTATPPYQYRFFMTRQKCESVKFTIQDLAPTTGSWSQAYTLSNMAFEVGVKKGLNKIPASKTVG